ncbi:MAG TPA: sugar ABC transporter ATP-binding protein [Thermotogota bacterium]|nr:sugar ABC transporter ATP-binding protein [Thermotogota bacterium]HRW92945.1 sugar ABC transporter ATP-binding protein [Thermotogota bacterium]
MQASTVLRMEGICKEFPGVRALDNVNFDLLEGEVHVLLGENGAGKSTLMKILSGAYSLDSGTILLDGKQVHIKDPAHAMELGIGTIYQEFNLVPFFSAAENIFLGREFKNAAGMVDWRKMFAMARKEMENVGLMANPRKRIMNMSVAEKQLVEIAKALSLRSRILVFDEPTATLSEKDVDHLFLLIDQLKKQGKSIVYISHRMEEIKRVGDRCTVLRDGKYIDTVNVKDSTRDELIKMVAGRSVDVTRKTLGNPCEDVVLDVKGLRAVEKVHDVSFQLRRGEILGFAGLVGSGRTETMKTLVGEIPRVAGEVLLEGKKVFFKHPARALKNGLVYLSEDRKDEGLVLKMNVRHNVSLGNLKEICRRGLLSFNRERVLARKQVEALRIKCPGDSARAENLSGGNQQKVIIGRALSCNARVFLFDEPTRGIDVGAKEEIYNILLGLAGQGYAIVMVSSELPEILRICNRVVVMREGNVTAILENSDLSQDTILHYAMGE